MKSSLHNTGLCIAALASIFLSCATANAQSTRAIAAVESRSAQSDSVFHTVGWRNGNYGRGYGYSGRPYANYYAPQAYYAPRARYYAPNGYRDRYGDYYGSRYGYGYPYGAARVGPVRVFWR